MRLSLISGLLAVAALTACTEGGLVPYERGPDTVIATNADGGTDRSPLVDGHAAIAYDPDGCQAWIMDDGVEGYSGRRYDPKTGLPVCNDLYAPGTVVGEYRSQNRRFNDRVPGR